MKEVIVVGGSGLVGNELVKQLIENKNIVKIHLLVRKEIPFNDPKVEVHIIDFTNESQLKNAIQGEIIYCCIGTTKAKTPNLSDYEKIDRDIPIRLAQLGFAKGISQFHLISAIGANAHSKINYNRIKGEAEEGVIDSNIPCVFIYRPGMLIGKRSESRPMEYLAQIISPIFDFFLMNSFQKFHSVKASNLAKTMVKNSFLPFSSKINIITFPQFEK
jgi:uncharacterized protein YbjT (DUF2867 family)